MDPTGTKMKGLLKGLRYISQIFDNKEEEEMQIGYPTDVKHVAHIGWDGNSSSSPGWMNEFRPGGADTSGGVIDHHDTAPSASASRLSRRSESTVGDGGADPVTTSPNHEAQSSGRHQSTSGTSDPSATQEPPTGASRHVRRHRSNVGSVTGEAESTGGAKQARRRRSKAASSSAAGGDAKESMRSTSKLKPQASAADLGSEEQS